MSTATDSPRYFAFISYSHQDQLWADWLHKALENYRVPRRLIGQTTAVGAIPSRLLPIFRDRDELASATDLSRTVNAALARSTNLIVICSPNAAASRWVDEEVLAFKRLGGGERIFCLIVGGEPNASELPGREAEECFVPALRHVLGADGRLGSERTEPIAADARPGKDGRANAKLKVIAGLLDVGFDTLKQRELHRRNRRLAALASVAIVIMAITTMLAISAFIARNDAQRRQKQAEDLVGFMLGDLGTKLGEVQRLDIMEAVDDHAMKYFESLPTSDVTDESLVQRAKALEKIGSVRISQGHLPQAMESFEAASVLAEKLADAAPQDLPRQVAYSRVLAFAGMAEWNQGNLEKALEQFQLARSVIERATSQSANDPAVIFQLTSLDNNIGHVLEARGKLDEAEVQYRSMLAHCERLAAEKTVSTEWTTQLGAAHNNLGKLALVRGDLASAVAEYRADDAIESELSSRDPKNNDQRTNMFTVRAILGRTLALTGDISSAIHHMKQAVDIAVQVSAVDPTDTDVQENLALYRTQLSRLLRLNKDLAEANKLIIEAEQAFTQLTKADANNAAWQREFAETQLEHAAQLLAAAQPQLAAQHATHAAEALNPLFAKQPDNRATLLAIVAVNLTLARLASQPEAAQQYREGAIQMIESAKSGNNDPRLLALRVEALLTLGRGSEASPVIRQLWNSGYRDLALLNLLQQEQIDYPVNLSFQQELQVSASQNVKP